jgi:hypothetical protein
MVYPVTANTAEIVDGLNIALAGPGGLGQGFDSFNSPGIDSTGTTQFDLTGNTRRPYTLQNLGSPHVPIVKLYVAPIALSTSEMLDERTWKYTFATPLVGQEPFVPGQPVEVSGVADSYYDGVYSPIGVVECTLTYVIVRSDASYPVVAASTGGTVKLTSMDYVTSTDCLARATVLADEQSVIITSQLNIQLFADPSYVGSYYYKVSINRYRAIPNNDPTNPDFVFVFDNKPINGRSRPPATLAYKEYLIPTTVTSHTHEQETIFTSIIDQPGVGYYQYILEVEFSDNSGGNIVTNAILTQRSFSAQVFKK